MAADEEEFDYEEWELEDEEETDLLPLEPESSKLRMLQETAIGHPRLTFGGGTFLLSLIVDAAIHDPFVAVLGVAAAAALGWKGEDLMQAFVPGSDQEAAREDADRFADNLLEGYPVYADQSANAKFKRLFHLPSADWTEVGEEPPPPQQGRVKKQQRQMQVVEEEDEEGEGELTHARIIAWLEDGLITNKQFFVLMQRIDERTQKADSESGESVKRLPKPRETGENPVKFNPESENISPDVSPEDEQAIIRTAFALQQANGKVTREEIKAALGWNNKKHWIVKTTCDKYNIAMK